MQLCSRSHFVSYRPSAIITENVPALHLPADKHVAYGMFIFPTQQFRSMYVVWHVGGKCIYCRRQISGPRLLNYSHIGLLVQDVCYVLVTVRAQKQSSYFAAVHLCFFRSVSVRCLEP